MKVNRREMHDDLPCVFCDFETKTAEALKQHKIQIHGVKCEFCEQTYISDHKLRTHMCRKHIPNPDYMDMYVKNWFIRNSCIPVFSKRLEKEIVLLHSEQCWEGKHFCSEIPENLDTNEKSVLDDNGLLHGPAEKSGSLGQDGVIFWLAVRGLMLGKMDGYHIL